MPVSSDPEDVGVWSDVFSWPLIGIHLVMTSDGKVLTFGTEADGTQSGLHIYDVWDPITDTHTTIEHHTNSDIFCAAVVIIPTTGEVLIAGGDARPFGAINAGIPDVNIYDPTDISLEASPTGAMAFSRWYGTAVTLANGQIVMIGGRSDAFPTFEYSAYAEIYTPGEGWRTLTGTYIEDFAVGSLYPRSFLTSKGEIWTYSDSSNKVYALDPSGQGSVELLGGNPTGITWNRPAVMYAPDKVLLIGDDGTAWIMDMSGDVPVYTQTESVGAGRVWANLTVLPDGRIMISGGSAVDNELVGVNNTVKIWDPDTGLWSTESDAGVARLYHSSTLLLADGTVLSLGGGAPGPLVNLNGERYSPDYLFEEGGGAADRPEIVDAPDTLAVGEDFTVTVAEPGEVVTLALIQFGAVTHSLNMTSQRIELPFTVNPDGTLAVDLPDNANVLVPGYWMLFALDADGTPSIAATIRIHSDLAFYEPTVLPLDLGVEMEANGTAAYDGYDDSFILTPEASEIAGSVMSEERLDLSQSFHIAFQINLGNNDAGADGMAFVLHNDPDGADALGDDGGGLGATEIVNGLAIQFDTFDNAEDPDDIANDHTGFFDTDTGDLVSPVVDLGNIEDGAWHDVELMWDGAVLTYIFDGVEIATLAVDIATMFLGGSQFAHFGFTGGTGGLVEELRVRINELHGTLEGGEMLHADRAETGHIPGFTANGDAAAGGGSHTFVLTPDEALQTGSVMSDVRIDLSESFSLTFEINLGAKDADGADGFAFVLHNDPAGENAIGGPGGAMGALNLADGLAIQFDTYQNELDPNDIANDHTSLIDTDTEALASPVVDLGNLEDGAWHSVTVTWDGDMLVYSVDGVEIAMLHEDIVAEYLGGSTFAHFGFTAATGGLSNEMQVRVVDLEATAEDGTLLRIEGPNDLPVAVNDAYTVAENGTLTIDAAQGVLANDSDPDGDDLHAEIEAELHHHGSMYPEHGTLTLNEDGSFTYTPDAGFVGIDHFHYYASDGTGRTDARVNITVTAGGPSTLPAFVVNGDAAQTAAATYTLTPDLELQAGSVMSAAAIDITQSFSLTFELNLGTKDAAGSDGVAFVLHADPLGNQALGGLGGAMGALNIANGLAIQFDTYQNELDPNDIANDHTSFIDTDSEALVSPAVDLGNIEDGLWHRVEVTWNGHMLSYSVDGVEIAMIHADLAADYLGGADHAWFGFTGATGGLSNLTQVRILEFNAATEPMVLTVAEYLAIGGPVGGTGEATIADTGAAIAALTAAQFADLEDNGIGTIDATNNVLALSVAQYKALGAVALSPDDTVTLADTGANLASLTTAQIAALAGKGIDRIDAADNLLSLTVSKALSLGGVALTAADQVVIADIGTNITVLSSTELAALAAKGVDRIDASDDVLGLNVAEYRALGTIGLAAADAVALVDTSTAIATLTVAEIAGLAAKGVDRIDSNHGLLSFSVAEYLALGSVALTAADDISLADFGAALGGLTQAQIAGLGAKGIDRIDAVDNAFALSVAEFKSLGTVDLAADDTVTLLDTGANLVSLSAAEIAALAAAGIEALDASNNALTFSLAQYKALGPLTVAASDVLTINGTGAAETINGRAYADVIRGDGGGDALLGLAGNDTLAGGLGNDTMTGGTGGDRFLFDTKAHSANNVDTIVDFSVTDDTIILDDAIFSKLDKGVLPGKAFYKGTAAHDSTDRIIYNSKTGALIYDSNGDKANGAVQFATIAKGLALTADDFLVI